DRVVGALVQAGNQGVPVDVLAFHIVDTERLVDLAVQGDGGAGELAVVGFPAIGLLAGKRNGDGSFVLELRQEVSVTAGVATTVATSAGGETEGDRAHRRRCCDCASKFLHHVGPFNWTRSGRWSTRGAATVSTGTRRP